MTRMPSRFVVTVLFCLFSASCSLQKPESLGINLNINLQETQPHAQLINAFTLTMFANPSTTSDINCFAANVTGPGVAGLVQMDASCTFSTDPTGRGFGTASRPTPRGQSIILDVSPGLERRIDIYGIFPPPPECNNGIPPSINNLGGYLIGSQTVDLTESKNITIPVSYTAGTSPNMTCTRVPPFITDLSIFGNGADGNATISASIGDVTTDVTVLGRTLAASRRIDNINTSDGKTLTLGSAFTTSDFNANDEIFWNVVGATTNSTCSSANELFPGKSGYARISSVNTGSNTITLATPMVTTPSAVDNSKLTAALASPFCRIQIVRVPNFDSLTLNCGGACNIVAPTFNYSAATGGIFLFRVKNTLNAAGAGSPTFQASGQGYQQSSTIDFAGDSINGQASAGGPGANASGGGGGNGGNGGAGGGHMGVGGSANGGGGVGGTTNTCGGTGECYFMGSAGGRTSGGTSAGAGGGIIMGFFKTLNITGAVPGISVGGVAGGSGPPSAGGGAGGTAKIVSQSNVGSFVLNGLGGFGGSSGTNGGGGGGGKTISESCTGTTPAATVTGGSPGGGIAASGGNGLALHFVNATYPFCPPPP